MLGALPTVCQPTLGDESTMCMNVTDVGGEGRGEPRTSQPPNSGGLPGSDLQGQNSRRCRRFKEVAYLSMFQEYGRLAGH